MFSSGRRVLLVVVAVAVIVVVGAGGWWFFIRDDAPPPASVEAAAGDSGSCDADLTVDDIQGTWTVDTSTGSVEEGTGTFAGYRIEEELANIGGQTAVGRTAGVSGDITVDGEQVTEGSFEVDMTTLESDQDQRDSRLRQVGLQTDTFPTASFTLTEPLDIPADAEACEEITLAASGDLELHGVTQPVEVDLDASFDGDQIVVAGSAPVVLADYDIEPPVGFRVVSIADNGTFELQIILTNGSAAAEGTGGATDSTEPTDASETTETTGY